MLAEESDFAKSSYSYSLPPELIAQYPAQPRDHARLLVYHQQTQQVEHRHFFELPEILPPQTLLVMNNSKVFPARLHGRRQTLGRGACEMILLRLTPVNTSNQTVYSVLLKSSLAKKIVYIFVFPDEGRDPLLAEIKQIFRYGSFGVQFSRPVDDWIERLGKIPLPAYIRQGKAEPSDTTAYQTVYASP